ncbi:GAF domain-containing protein [Fulvivirgaceae bacterium PWU4]|uniref:histidine kinase n=1 Tax=Chryseosolibacter histidini TaxID=2782349 RepID=A0AAP2DP85_9BACT|nr:ATP-binding protein [Chryseosolibacter histidini]MBT1699980.1 GAF domain-containing protein [Chryseosolibacter histidini]
MIETSDSGTLKLLVTTVQELSLARDLEAVMKIVRTVARKLTGADGATFVLRDGNLCFYADEDAISPLWKGSRFPMQTCISGWAMINKVPAVIEDIYQDSRIPHDAYRPTFVKSLAMVPIRAIAPIGAIGNYWATHHLPTKEEVNLLQALADITAVSIENVNVYRELEQRVKDRTAQLEAANNELEAFSYSVSHDLRAPLRSIIGYANVLEEDHARQLDDTGRRVLQTVQQNAGKMNTLIDEMLQFSRVGKKPLEKTPVDNEKLVRSVIEDLNHSTPNNASFEIAALPPVTADEVLLQQVWVNLLSNAVKYTSKKEQPIITVGSYKNGNEMVYLVKDNGAGFDMKYAEKLFGAFQRLHRMNDFPGSGVGLALAYRIITRHGGKIWAEGKVNEGATFYFSLPINPQ